MANAPVPETCKGGRGNDDSLAMVRNMRARGCDKAGTRQHLYSENFEKARVSQLLGKIFPKAVPKKELANDADDEAATSKPIMKSELAIDAVKVQQPAKSSCRANRSKGRERAKQELEKQMPAKSSSSGSISTEK